MTTGGEVADLVFFEVQRTSYVIQRKILNHNLIATKVKRSVKMGSIICCVYVKVVVASYFVRERQIA
jgi:hypothetical protein